MATLTPTEKKVLDAIDMGALLQFLDEIVAIESLNGTAAENEVQAAVATKLKDIGLEVDQWEIDFEALSQHPAFCTEVERERGLGVVGLYGDGGEGKGLILNGHTDVVPAGDLKNWLFPAWRATFDEASGRVYGRGALDMKGGLCCGIFAAKAIVDAGVKLKGKLMIQSVIGEEDGGVGALATVARGYRGDAAVIMEPTELTIAPAQAGALNFRVVIPGKAAHGALRTEGVDPLEKFLLVYQSILAFESVRNANVQHPLFANYELPYPICVGTIRAGNWASSVAESLTFEGRFGVAVDEDTAEAKQKFEDIIAQTAEADDWLRENPPTVEWWGGQFAPASIDPEHEIVQLVQNAYQQVTGETTAVKGVPYGADMRLLVNEGETPTVLFGPGDVRKAHQPDEFVPLAQIETAVRTLALLTLRFCGYEALAEVTADEEE